MTKKTLTKKKDTSTQKELSKAVQDRINSFIKTGELVVPEGYSIGNAIKSAFLILQETYDKNKRPALSVCTKTSIYNALLKMCILGLYPELDQGYFIVYGNRLVFQISTFGYEAIFKRLTGGTVRAQIIYQDDEFEYDMVDGEICNIRHKQSFQNIDPEKIVGAYAVVKVPNGNGNIEHVEPMTWDEIVQAWKQGQYKEGVEGVHTKFTQEMVKKTVINRAIKRFLKSSPKTRDGLTIKTLEEAESDVVEAQTDDNILEEANTVPIEQEVKQKELQEEKQEEKNIEELFDINSEEEYQWEVD